MVLGGCAGAETENRDMLTDGLSIIIKNAGTGRYLNMQLAGMVEQAKVIQLAQTRMLDEVWLLEQDGAHWRIKNAMTGRYISWRSHEAGGIIELKSMADESGLWQITQAADDGSYSIRPAADAGDTALAFGFAADDISVMNEPLLLEFSGETPLLAWEFIEVELPFGVPAMLPVAGDIFHSSCPQMIKDGDTYYLYIMYPGISIKESQDMVNWKSVGRVFPGGDPSWLAAEVPGYGIWAPSAYRIGDLYYVYYCISTIGSQNSAIGVAVNTTLDIESPDFRWRDLGMVIRSHTGDAYNCIDPNIIMDDSGRIWLTFGSFWNGLYQMEIDPATGHLIDPAAEPIHIAQRTVNNGAIEAPWIVRRDGYYYLFVAFNPMDLSYHNRVGRSESVHGPYLDREGREMLKGGGSVVTQGLLEMTMPGHASVFIDDDGSCYLVGEYFRTASLSDFPSILYISSIVWDDEGWPITALTPDIYLEKN